MVQLDLTPEIVEAESCRVIQYLNITLRSFSPVCIDGLYIAVMETFSKLGENLFRGTLISIELNDHVKLAKLKMKVSNPDDDKSVIDRISLLPSLWGKRNA